MLKIDSWRMRDRHLSQNVGYFLPVLSQEEYHLDKGRHQHQKRNQDELTKRERERMMR